MSAKNLRIIFGLLLAVICLVLGWTLSHVDETAPQMVEGSTVPDWSFSNRQGRSLSFGQLRGKVLLINFWATWCPPCLEELPSLDSLRQTIASQPILLFAFSADTSWEPIDKLMSPNGYGITVYADFQRTLATRFGTLKYPETYIVDKKGIIRLKVIGPTNWMAPEIRSFLWKLAAEGSGP
jgi:cytochrome c biogenesis protein CcmG, thiol:disulfide interchange protein DsbE